MQGEPWGITENRAGKRGSVVTALHQLRHMYNEASSRGARRGAATLGYRLLWGKSTENKGAGGLGQWTK